MSAKDHKLYFLLQRVAHRLKKEADAALLESGGMSTAQAAVMTIIAEEDGVSQKYLAQRLMQRESAITTMANRLLKAGYITRTRSDTDARAWVLKPAPAGMEALRSIRSPFGKINNILDEAFEDADLDQLARGLEQVLDQLGAPPEKSSGKS
ncbi:MAG: MarR family transcriptional regulator [Pseudomonadota bacterium]